MTSSKINTATEIPTDVPTTATCRHCDQAIERSVSAGAVGPWIANDDATHGDTCQSNVQECGECGGSGAVEIDCSDCEGAGESEDDLTCETCGGDGVDDDVCGDCDGAGEHEGDHEPA